MAVNESGGVPIALLHGWGSNYATLWRGSKLESAIERSGRTSLRVDLPGHGIDESRNPADYFDLAGLLADRLPAGPLDAVGFSLGGKLLLQLAAEQPQRFRRLVVCGVGANYFRPENGRAIADALLAGPNAQTPPAVRSVIEEALASGNDLLALAAVIQRPARRIEPNELAHVQAEVLLVVGSDDTIAGAVDALLAVLPRATAIVLDDLDHASTPRSEVFQTAAETFLLHVRTGATELG